MDILLNEVVKYYDYLSIHVNNSCKNYEAFEIIVGTFCVTCVLSYIWFCIFRHRRKGTLQRLKEWMFRMLRFIPAVRNRVEMEISRAKSAIELQMLEDLKGMTFLEHLPHKGQTKEAVLSKVKEYHSLGKVDWRRGLVSGAVYKAEDPSLQELVSQTYHVMAWTNPLHPDIFPSVRKMEVEIVRMVCNLYNGDQETCGTVTSGGTESIFMACKAYRDYALEVKGIEHPEMVIPVTAHAAFDKAGQILQVKVVHVPLNPQTMTVDLRAMKGAITSNTCMLVGSAPPYPHGVIDPILEIAKLGVRHGIPVHVDACLGGFLVPFMRAAGFPIDPVDFSVKGVTSISCDTHKYGYAPKGTSVVMYRNKTYRRYQFSVVADWPGGIYATPLLGGSRSGGAIGTCWVSLLYYGFEGYVQSTRRIIQTTRRIINSLQSVPGIYVPGDPQVSVLSVASRDFDIYRLSQALSERGWNLSPLQFPPAFHLCVTQLHTAEGVADTFIRDVQECTAVIMKDPKAPATGKAAIYGMAQTIPDRTLVSEICQAFLDAYYDIQSSKECENGSISKKDS